MANVDQGTTADAGRLRTFLQKACKCHHLSSIGPEVLHELEAWFR